MIQNRILFMLSLLTLCVPFTNLHASDLLVTSENTGSVLRYDGVTGNFVEAFIPDGTGGLSAPLGITFGPDGNLFVTDLFAAGGQVLKFDGIGGFLSAIGPANTPAESITVGPDGQLYVPDVDEDVVFRVTTQGVSAPFATGVNEPFAVAFGPDGNLYVSSDFDSSVLRFNGTTGQLIDTFVASSSGGLAGPRGLAFGPDGNLYISSFNTDSVIRYSGSDGSFLGEFVSTASGGLDGPYGILFRTDGNLYVTSLNTDQILRYNGSTGAFIDAFVSAGSGGLNVPHNIALMPAGNLQFSAGQFTVNEAGGTAAIEITRTNGSNGAVTVQFATSDGTAIAGTDYSAVSQTLTFADGTASQTVTIPILNDELNEGNKTVNLTLSNPTQDAALGNPSTAILTIEDNDNGGGSGGCRLAPAGTQSSNVYLAGLGILLMAGSLRLKKSRSL